MRTVTDDELRLIVWTVMDGCLVKRFNKTLNRDTVHRIQFKLSKKRKIDSLKRLLDRIGLPYTFNKCKKSGLNKLQPYYIRIYGSLNRRISRELLNGVKQFPEWFLDLNKKKLKIILSIIAITDGSKSYAKYVWPTTNKHDYDIIRTLCSIHNAKYIDYGPRSNRGGFVNSKIQYVIGFYLW